MPARLAADALRPTALPLPAPYLAERRSGHRSGSAAAAASRPACGTAGPAAASLAPSLLLPAPSAVLSAPHALAPPQLSPRAASASSASTCACSAWHPIWARCRTTWHIRPAARATPEAAGQRAAAGLALPAATRRFPVLPHARREDALASKGLLSAQVPAHRPRRSGTRKGAGHGVERAKVPKRSWASRTGAASWTFLHCTYLHSPSGTRLRSCRLRHSVACSAEMLRALEQEEGRRHSLAGPPRGGRPAEHWRAGAWTTSPTKEDPEAF
ncbi:uncharacterized protein LOC114884525 [Monodon monoceros]|uniref:uncharacterized protein LOC114884525 n=1 Tax=Monodon monoceros TaxID=40151 RepID=UPI0010F525B7|nr:uncharacterized protein LOC114884525 [Monodon monoceros]